MQRVDQRSKQVQMIGRMSSLKVRQKLMMQMVDQKPALNVEAGQRWELTRVAESVWHPLLCKCLVG